MKQLPLGISTFREIIEQNYLYIDKTKEIYKLLSNKYIFLSRPRRFGKSLLVSTLKELFSGNKELFKDLWIYKNTYYHWNKFPIIKLDFSSNNTLDSHKLENSLCGDLDTIALQYNIDISKYETSSDKLKNLTRELGDIEKVVILIDEYDSPILSHLHDIAKAEEIKEILKNFFTTIKSLDEYIHKVFITGVTKIAKISVFSGLNNLNDISTDSSASTLLGYTATEIDIYFPDYIKQVALALNLTVDNLKEKIRCKYNGYSFSENLTKVYNPFSIAYFFAKQKFANYWFASATPTFLITLAKKQLSSLQDLLDILNKNSTVSLSEAGLSSFELTDIPIYSALFQTGYLTIVNYDISLTAYELSYPNEEVQESLEKYLVTSLINSNIATNESNII